MPRKPGDREDDHYVHGTYALEQARLSRLNALLNASSLSAMALCKGERVLDVGSGLGQFTRMIRRAVGTRGLVVGVERNPEQLAEALSQAVVDGEEHVLEFRRGDAVDLPLRDDEWGTFDVAHARFVLEHVTEPLAVVRSMCRAIRPGGRIVLEDDDHETLRLWPEPPGVLDLWRAYYLTYQHQGKDPYIGRRLVKLLHDVGAKPVGNRLLFFGSCAGSRNFHAMIDNFLGIIEGARHEMVSMGLSDDRKIDKSLQSFVEWKARPDAAMWYSTCWAEGTRLAESDAVGASGISVPAHANQSGSPSESELMDPASASGSEPAEGPASDETSLLRFLMAAAAELNSSLKLEKVFHKIATGIRPLIDYHLFCVMLWNEKTQMLEHSFSMKYGKAIPQKGGFPLGYGLSGSAAQLRQPIRASNVLEDSRYVRYRHPEVEIRSELAVPLIFHNELIGVIDLESTEFDYFTEQQEQMVSTLASSVAGALVNARLHEKVLRDEQRLERDLATAREIQRGLLPTTAPNVAGLDIGSVYSPARELGGDFYDFLPYPDGRLAVAIGDVVGKATPAALLGSMAVGLLRGRLVQRPWSSGEMLMELNDHLYGVVGDNRFVAMTYAIVDPANGELRIANAGMPRARIVRAGAIEELRIHGTPLGLLPGTKYEEKLVRISVGDVLVLCSDGLLEAEDARGNSFESTGLDPTLLGLTARSAAEIAHGLNRAVLDFTGREAVQRDDYAAVVIRIEAY